MSQSKVIWGHESQDQVIQGYLSQEGVIWSYVSKDEAIQGHLSQERFIWSCELQMKLWKSDKNLNTVLNVCKIDEKEDIEKKNFKL